jgi:SatD family (SatD)
MIEMPKPSASPKGHSIAIIGDMVGSRKLNPAERKSVQAAFNRLIRQLNGRFADALEAKFNIALGDEFEGLLASAAAPAVIPLLIWTVEKDFPSPVVRLGIGHGSITADSGEFASDWDGPAFHRAREAIDLAKTKRQLGGLFRGFGDNHDAILNGLARVLHYQRDRWSDQQRKVAQLLHDGNSQIAVAGVMGLSRQAVSSYAAAAGWSAYAQGEIALGKALEEALAPYRNHLPNPSL